jgi:hypothetical protein
LTSISACLADSRCENRSTGCTNRFQTSDNQRYNEEHRNIARLSTGLVIRC